MDDELEKKEGLAESADGGGEEKPESGETGTAKEKARIAELEQALTEKDTEIALLKRTGLELEEKCRELGDSLGRAVTGYKTMIVKANPEIVEDLISGDTIEAANESLEKAKVLVSRVREGVEAEISKVKVPAGAPERTVPDLSSLSPGEKIRYALGGNE